MLCQLPVLKCLLLTCRVGNIGDVRYQAEVGDAEFPWMREYGSAWKIHGCMGVRVSPLRRGWGHSQSVSNQTEEFMVADPKALQHILQTSAYHYPKTRDTRASLRMLLGQGIVWVHGACERIRCDSTRC